MPEYTTTDDDLVGRLVFRDTVPLARRRTEVIKLAIKRMQHGCDIAFLPFDYIVFHAEREATHAVFVKAARDSRGDYDEQTTLLRMRFEVRRGACVFCNIREKRRLH